MRGAGLCPRAAEAGNRARSVLRTQESAASCLGLKHGDAPIWPAVRALDAALGRGPRGADLLVPVQLHWTRLFTAATTKRNCLTAGDPFSAGGLMWRPDWGFARRRTRRRHRDRGRASSTVRGALRCERPQRRGASGWEVMRRTTSCDGSRPSRSARVVLRRAGAAHPASDPWRGHSGLGP